VARQAGWVRKTEEAQGIAWDRAPTSNAARGVDQARPRKTTQASKRSVGRRVLLERGAADRQVGDSTGRL